MVVFGTRPEAIKLAPVILALRESEAFEPVVTVTGQHREMLDQVLELFSIRPDFDLDVIQQGQSLTDVTERVLRGLESILKLVQPDVVLVQGDTTTTFAAALAAFYQRIPVIHLEAGLRTNDPYSPYPEEINRRLTTQLAAVHLAPTPLNKAQLLKGGVREDRVLVIGNTVIDALIQAVELGADYGDDALSTLDDDSRRVLLVTAHRRESWGAPLQAVGRAIAEISETEPDVLTVFPLHRNPVVRQAIVPTLRGLPNVLLTEPLMYGGFVRLMNRAHLILTDSGGVQEEGPSLGKPVLVLRATTERPEAVASGTARLVGTDTERIVREVRRLLRHERAYSAMATATNPYGDGLAAQRTLEALSNFFGLGPSPEEFRSPRARARSIAPLRLLTRATALPRVMSR